MEPNALDIYNSEINTCTKCELSKSRTNFVFGCGNPNSDIVFVGEAPGKNEDIEGQPFVGRSGKLLNKILLAIELKREDVYILNVLKCRPPRNRDPLLDEIDKCEPYLLHQLDIVSPKLIVALGRIAGNTLLRKNVQLKELRNTVHNYNGIDMVVTYHPAALFRNSNFKKECSKDFKMIKRRYLD